MKIHLFLLLIFLSIAHFIAAQNIQQADLPLLKGKWVKTTNARDTLFFEMRKGTETLFILTLQKGTHPPRDPEGLYSFKFVPTGITVNWMFSSTVHNSKPIPFRFNDSKTILTIGNFYRAKNEGELLDFKQLK